MDVQGHVVVLSSPNHLVSTLALIAVAGLIWAVFRNRGITTSKPTLPKYAPFEIFLASSCLVAGGIRLKLISFIRRYGGPLFGVTSTHQVIYQKEGIERFLSQPLHTLGNEPVAWTIHVRVFGSEDDPALRQKTSVARKELSAAVEKVYMSDRPASECIEEANIPRHAYSLVTLSASDSLTAWESLAQYRLLVSETKDQPGAAELNLFNLIRSFGAAISIPMLYGSDYMKRNFNVLRDFWAFDNDCFPLVMAGVPLWAPLKHFQEGLAARARINRGLAEFFERLDKHLRGEDLDPTLDLTDVSQIVMERNEIFNKYDFKYRDRGDHDAALLWGQNGNMQPSTSWLIIYIYATPGLLASLRQEIAPHVSISTADNDYSHPYITRLDMNGLQKHCPLLRSTWLETFRVANEPSSLRYIAKPLQVTPESATLQPGTFVTVPHAIHQHDPSLYPDPDRFIPDRFVRVDAATGERRAPYGPLKPWGGGHGICKGRVFAEKHIFAVVASIVSLWDFEPASGGEWKVPGMRPGTGIMRPTEEVRVVARRRRYVE
ncbi:putative cytochrome P450 [Phyllosticta capitalensis]|uniref:putative cytochrome P450 n=1 Tax=Phyllosticta capitalensis TaxID=121624 RepID=UPI00312F0815